MASLIKPKVLILGSSRAMQIRPAFFKGREVYNAGGAIQDLSHLLFFSREIEKKQLEPQSILLVVDWWWFAPSNDRNLVPEDLIPLKDKIRIESDIAQERKKPYQKFLNVSRLMVNDLISNFPLYLRYLRNATPCGTSSPIGISALLQGSGFRSDGSYYYGERSNGCVINRDYRENLDFISEINSKRLREVRFQSQRGTCHICQKQFIHWLNDQKSKDRFVAILLPPVPPYLHNYLFESEKIPYLIDALNWLKEQASQRGFAYYDAMWEHPYEESEGYLDVSHPTETTIAKILLDFAKFDQKYAEITNVPFLEKILASAPSKFDLGLKQSEGKWVMKRSSEQPERLPFQ